MAKKKILNVPLSEIRRVISGYKHVGLIINKKTLESEFFWYSDDDTAIVWNEAYAEVNLAKDWVLIKWKCQPAISLKEVEDTINFAVSGKFLSVYKK